MWDAMKNTKIEDIKKSSHLTNIWRSNNTIPSQTLFRKERKKEHFPAYLWDQYYPDTETKDITRKL